MFQTNGDNSSNIHDCLGLCVCNGGVPNGDSLLDECGTCDADASNDCVQDCGICGGDNSSCGLYGVPNGHC